MISVLTLSYPFKRYMNAKSGSTDLYANARALPGLIYFFRPKIIASLA